MVLDPIVQDFSVVNLCRICTRKGEIPVFVVKKGHNGSPLSTGDHGPFTNVHFPPGREKEKQKTSLQYGALFTWRRRPRGQLALVKPYFPSLFAGSLYASGGSRLPDFGNKIGQVFWICPNCVDYLRGRGHIWILVWDQMKSDRNLPFVQVWDDIVEEKRQTAQV